MKVKNLIMYVLIGSTQTRRDAVLETRKMLSNIKLTTDNYDINKKIEYLIDNKINVKYKGR